MEQMEFDAVGPGGHGGPGGLHHHGRVLPRQAQDDMGHHFDARRLQPPHRIEIHFGGIAPADILGSGFLDGLQAQLHGNGLDPVDLGQQFQHVVSQAVGPGADGKAHDVLRGNGFEIQPAQGFRRGVGVGKGLKIGDVFAALILGADPLLGPFQLDGDGIRAALGELAAAGAEDAAPNAQSPVPVGTGKAAVQG